MKRVFSKCKKFALLVLTLLLALTAVTGLSFSKISTNVKASSISTNYYKMSYENNKLSILLNGDVTSYTSVQKSDLGALKDAIKDYVFQIVKEDLNFGISNNTNPQGLRRPGRTFKLNALPQDLSGIDMSLLSGIIGSQLADKEAVNDALLGEDGVYDTLIEFYVDRYVDTYVTNNNVSADDKADVYTEVANQLTTVIVNAAKDAYGEDVSETPVAAITDYINQRVETVSDLNEAGQKVEVTLSDVANIVNTIEDVSKVVEVVNSSDINVTAEINQIITNASASEVTDFFKEVPTETIVKVVKDTNAISGSDVKDIVSNVGIDNLIEIADTIGMDNIKDLLDAADINSDDIQDIIDNYTSELDLGTVLKALKAVKVDGNVVFDENGLNKNGLVTLAKKVLNWAKGIKDYNNDQMKMTFDVVIATSLGDIQFDLEVGFYGDSSLIRTIFAKLSAFVDYENVNGVYTVTLNIPESLADLVNELLSGDYLSQELKDRLFADTSLTLEELYAKFDNTTLEEYVELLKTVDYEKLITKLMSADTWNTLFDTDRFTNENIDKVVNKVIGLVKKLQTVDYAKVRDVLGISKFDGTVLETLVNKFNTYANKFNLEGIDAAYLRALTNEQVNNKLDKLTTKADLYNKAKSYIDKAYNKVPASLKTKTLMSVYEAEGVFGFSANVPVERIIDALPVFRGYDLGEMIKSVIPGLPENVDVSLTVNGLKLYKVTYMVGEEKNSEGLLVGGADLSKYGPTEVVANDVSREILKWVDADNNEVTEMTEADLTVYAVFNFEVEVSDDYTGVYDGENHEISVTVTPATNDAYTYQWYKDGVLVDGATNATLALKDVADSGVYKCVVTSGLVTVESDEITVTITKKAIDVSEYTWNYTEELTYDGTAKEVKLTAFDEELLTATYANNNKTNAGSYTASVTFTLIDADNYELEGSTPDCLWNINKAKINVSEYTWDYTGAFTYDGAAKKVELTEFDSKLTPAYTNNDKTNAGSYTAEVTFTVKAAYKTNYEVYGSVEACAWVINKATIDVSEYTWNYTDPFTYDTTTKKVELTGVSNLVNVEYANNSKANSGTYTASATVTVKDATNYEVVGTVPTCEWVINKALIKTSEYTWDYTGAFTYSGEAKTVELSAYDAVAIKKVNYTDNSKVNAGSYTAKVTFELRDANNYEIDQNELVLSWTIDKVLIDNFKLTWQATKEYTYNPGSTYTVKATLAVKTTEKANELDKLEVVYTDNAKANAGSYTAKAVVAVKAEFASNYMVETNEVSTDWKINKRSVDVSAYAWNYTNAFTFDGAEKKVELTGVSSLVNVAYANNANTNVGTYTASATVTAKDAANYEVVGTVPTCEWVINKAQITVPELTWTANAFTYDGAAKVVTITNLPENVTATYANNSNTNAGTYTASATLATTDNYELNITSATYEYTIAKAQIDVSKLGLEWNYTAAFEYDGTAKEVTLKSVPTGLKATYSLNKATDPGTYTARVTLTSTDSNYEVVGKVNNCEWEILAKAPTENNFESEDGKVKVESTNGVPESYDLSTSDVTDQYKDLNLSGVLADNERAKVVSATDIHFEENGVEKHITGDSFKVRMEIPAELIGKKIGVIHVADDNTVTLVTPITIDGNFVEFSTEGFSVFCIIELREIAKVPVIVWIILAILVLAAIALAVYFIITKKNKENEESQESAEAQVVAEEAKEVIEDNETEKVVEHSFFNDLVSSSDENKSFYDQIKDLIMAFEGVTDEINWHYETFSLEDGTVIVKFKMKNGKLTVTVPGVDPENTYTCIKNANRCNNCKANIAEVIEKLGLEKKEAPVEEEQQEVEQQDVEQQDVVEEAPAEETPAEEAPVEEEQQEVEQQDVVEETPVEETPVEETPAEETPAEEEKKED